jgi:hypothetical protein
MAGGSDLGSQQGQDFFPLHVVQTSSGAHQAPYPVGTGVLSKRSESGDSPLSNAEVKNMLIYTSIPPHVFMA